MAIGVLISLGLAKIAGVMALAKMAKRKESKVDKKNDSKTETLNISRSVKKIGRG